MHINAINSYCITKRKYTKPNFKGLIKDRSVIPVIKNMSEKDAAELKKIEKRLSRTKFWDMRISRVGNVTDELKFEFLDKKNKHGVITDGIYPYDKKDNTIKVYSIIYGPENITRNVIENLKYKSSSRAEKVYNKYLQNIEMIRLRRYNLTPLENIKSKEIELRMLEESSHFAEGNEKLEYVNTELLTKDSIGNGFKDKL